jgi:hypothetical protein
MAVPPLFAAGHPGTRGGYALSASVSHFLATSAVTADATAVIDPTAMHTDAATALPDFRFRSVIPAGQERSCSLLGWQTA